MNSSSSRLSSQENIQATQTQERRLYELKLLNNHKRICSDFFSSTPKQSLPSRTRATCL